MLRWPALTRERCRFWASALWVCVLWATPLAANAAELAYLGRRGTYSEQAAQAYREHAPGYDATVPMESIAKLVEAVRSGDKAAALIPAVATTSGFPAETTRTLLASLDPGVRIIGEVHIPVDIDLLVQPGTKLSDIKTVLSHPNALGEAATWLSRNLPDATWQETRSTAAAAEQVAAGTGGNAAVAGPEAAELYGLDPLAERIQDNKDNATSFFAIAKTMEKLDQQHADRIAVSLDSPPASKTFSLVVAALSKVGFTVVTVNSVPLPGPLFGYRYMLVLAADQPTLLLRATDAIARDSRVGGGKALLIGAWRQGS
jgi:prephenate dehydratase